MWGTLVRMTANAPARRFLSVDVLRGFTVAFMILVNDAGDWKRVYRPLDHAEWNGWTITDLVFPTFLFLVGCSIVFAIQARLRRGVAKSAIALQVFRRAVTIFLIKMFLEAFPYFHYTHLRIFGVLTRIAVCYAIAAWLFLCTRNWRVIAGAAVILLVGYWALLRFVPVPGFGHPGVDVPFLDPTGNLTSYLDRGFNNWTQHWLHTGVLYRGTRDPEGLLSTLPSIATTLLGMLAGLRLTKESGPDPLAAARSNAVSFAVAGALCIGAGELWSIWFPINKNMWTSSYVLLAGGIALLGLALCHWVFDGELWHERHKWLRALAWPCIIFGSNAIFAYALADLLQVTLYAIMFHTAQGYVSLSFWLYHSLFAWGGSTENSSLAWACFFVVLCFVPTWILWRRKWFLRV